MPWFQLHVNASFYCRLFRRTRQKGSLIWCPLDQSTPGQPQNNTFTVDRDGIRRGKHAVLRVMNVGLDHIAVTTGLGGGNPRNVPRMYCLPPAARVTGNPWTEVPSLACQRTSPVLTSTARK
jgi:hypothetical protein